MKKLLIVFVCIWAYLGIGWNLGSYYHKNIFTKHSTELTTFAQKTLTGLLVWEKSFYKTAEHGGGENTLHQDCKMMSVWWPLFLTAPYAVWVVDWLGLVDVAENLGV